MPFEPAGGSGGGGVLGLGPLPNTFGVATTANRAAAEVLRDAQAATAAWLTLYNDNLSFWIRLVWSGGVAEQRRNAAGTGWQDVSNVIRGQTGPIGPIGPVLTASEIGLLLDGLIGNPLWRSRISGTDLVDAVDLAVGSTVWRTAHTTLRNSTQIIAVLDAHLGTTWRDGGTGLDAAAVTAAIAAAGHDTPAARDTAIAAAIAAAGHDTPSARDTAIIAAIAAADHDTPAERNTAIAAAIAASVIASAGAIPVTLLTSQSIADPGASVVATELTLTANIVRGYFLEFVEAGIPASVGYITSDLILDQSPTYNSAPSANVPGRVAIKIQTSSDKTFGHDTIHLWRSDEANKIWFAAGRTGMQTLTIRAYPLSAAVEDWAKTGNTDQIPADRLGNAPASTGGGITTAQATDAAGALLDTVSFFTYDSSTDVLTLAIPNGYILPAMLVDGTNAQKTAFRTKIDAEQSGAVRPDGTVAFTAVIAGVSPVSDADLSTRKFVNDADALRALLSGATFTGTTGGIAPVGSSDFITKEYADANYSGGSSTPTTAHDLIAGWSADTSISDAEITAGANSATNSVVLPTETGSFYMFIWRANADGGDPSEVHIGPAGNSRTLFGAATAKTVGSIVGVLIVSVNTFNTVATGGETVRVI